MILDSKKVILKHTSHIHDPNETEIKNLIGLKKIKNQAVNFKDVNTDIISNTTCELNDDDVFLMPSFEI